jgi:hypothetical protein
MRHYLFFAGLIAVRVVDVDGLSHLLPVLEFNHVAVLIEDLQKAVAVLYFLFDLIVSHMAEHQHYDISCRDNR